MWTCQEAGDDVAAGEDATDGDARARHPTGRLLRLIDWGHGSIVFRHASIRRTPYLPREPWNSPDTVPLSSGDLALATLLASAVFAAVAIEKLLRRRADRTKPVSPLVRATSRTA